jgi:Concanavalin A-like lectin/glucanases superfamily
MASRIMTGILLCLLWLCPPSTSAQVPLSSLDRQAPLAQGLVAWWYPLPGVTGSRTWYDLLGRSHATLTNMGTAGTTSGWAVGTLPGTLREIRFDGSDDYVVTTSGRLLNPPRFTLMAWVKIVAIGGSAKRIFSADGSSRELDINTAGRLATNILGTGYNYSSTGTAVLGTNQWYHIAWSYRNAESRVYLNCVMDFDDAGGGAGDAFGITAPLVLGRSADTATLHFTGAMTNIRVYARVLPPGDICTAMREASLGEPRLLPPALLTGLLSGVPPSALSFTPFFTPQ